MKTFMHVLVSAMFWLWNLLFLTLVYLGILPFIGIPLAQATFEGVIPVEFFLTVLLIIGVPTVSTIVGGTTNFRRAPFRLISLFYGIEIPVFLLLLLRMFLIRERAFASTFMLGTLLVCIAAFAAELFYGYAANRRKLAWLQLLTHSLMLLTAVYVSTLLLLYALPLAAVALQEFFKFHWLRGIFEMLTSLRSLQFLFWGAIWGGLFLVTITMFLAMPAAFVSLYLYSGGRLWQRFAAQYGKIPAWIGTAAMLLAWLLGFALAQHQPQQKAFDLLAEPPRSVEERRERVKQARDIRAGLLNAYVFRYRYLSTVHESNALREMYQDVFSLNRSTAQVFQDALNFLLSPFLYRGNSDDDEKAAALYAEFFDQPIQRGERRALQHALRSTYDQDEVKAGLLDINQERVWLARQQVTIDPRGDWANVELYEVYENQTADAQEVFYSFSLPESAVMTGLWLGESEDRAQRYAYQISPRGAAQQVYTAEVRRWQDPALLEQVGPRHYRLRAFPIPPKPMMTRQNDAPQPRMHLWLTYKILRQDGQWFLPHLGEKRNVYWTKKTACNYNGYHLKHPGDAWLPESLQANVPAQAESHQAVFDQGSMITATPMPSADYSLPQGKRVAVLLDTSYSMTESDTRVEASLNWLQQELAAQNAVDLYVIDAQAAFSRRVSDFRALSSADLVFYGSVQFQDMLRQFDRLRGDSGYDAILLLTDAGSYELADNDAALPDMPAPLWMIHLGGLPQAYDDDTLRAIESSGGGVGTNVIEVARRLASAEAMRRVAAEHGGASVINVVDGYVWRMERAEHTSPVENLTDWRDRFEPLAARQFIIGVSKQVDLTQLERLDAIHAVAKTMSIVSPYSSMIVLVNDAQRKALEEAEAQADRFEREVEDGQETLTKPSNPLHDVSAVPEPGTIFLALIGLAGIAWARRRTR